MGAPKRSRDRKAGQWSKRCSPDAPCDEGAAPMNARSESPLTRRHFLWEAGAGLSGLALAWMFQQETRGAAGSAVIDSPYAPKAPHFPAKAKRVIHICACGGVSHLDTYD